MNLQYFKATLRKQLRERKLTLSALSVQADLSEDTLRSIIYGKSQDIKLSTIIKIADVFECSIDDMIGHPIYTEEERSTISRMRRLCERSKRSVQFILDFEEKTTLCKSMQGKDIIMVYLPTGNMNDGMFFDSFSTEELDISEYPDLIKENTAFALKVITSHFEPIYYPNDILLFSHKSLPEYGDITFYLDHNQRIYIRKYTEKGLEPINEFGETIPPEQYNKYTSMGVVLRVVKEFNIEQYR